MVHYQSCGCKIKDTGEMEPFCVFFTFNPNNFDKVIKQPEIRDNYIDLGFEILNLTSKDLWIEIIFKMWIVIWKLCFNFVNRKNNPNFTPQVKMNRIEERIRQIMESENLSQQDFAKLLEISPASLSSIFNGRTRPTHNHTNAIHTGCCSAKVKCMKRRLPMLIHL